MSRSDEMGVRRQAELAYERWRDADTRYRSGRMAQAGYRAGYLRGWRDAQAAIEEER